MTHKEIVGSGRFLSLLMCFATEDGYITVEEARLQTEAVATIGGALSKADMEAKVDSLTGAAKEVAIIEEKLKAVKRAQQEGQGNKYINEIAAPKLGELESQLKEARAGAEAEARRKAEAVATIEGALSKAEAEAKVDGLPDAAKDVVIIEQKLKAVKQVQQEGQDNKYINEMAAAKTVEFEKQLKKALSKLPPPISSSLSTSFYGNGQKSKEGTKRL